MVVEDQDGHITFLKKVKPGPSNNSYGIHVARLAGLPESVIGRAETILANLPEQSKTIGALIVKAPPRSPVIQSSLFSPMDQIEAELRNFNIENSTPLQGLALLERWKKSLK